MSEKITFQDIAREPLKFETCEFCGDRFYHSIYQKNPGLCSACRALVCGPCRTFNPGTVPADCRGCNNVGRNYIVIRAVLGFLTLAGIYRELGQGF